MSDSSTRDPLIGFIAALAVLIISVAVYFAVSGAPPKVAPVIPPEVVEAPVVEEPVVEEPAVEDPPQAPEDPDPEAEEPEPPQKAELPAFLKIVRPLDEARAARLSYQITGGALNIDTTNVERLRITREELPLSDKRSAPLRIDGQPFRLRARTQAVELQRRPTGEWIVISTD